MSPPRKISSDDESSDEDTETEFFYQKSEGDANHLHHHLTGPELRRTLSRPRQPLKDEVQAQLDPNKDDFDAIQARRSFAYKGQLQSTVDPNEGVWESFNADLQFERHKRR